MLTNTIYHKKQIADSFSRASKTYDQAAILQKAVGNHLLEKLKKLAFPQPTPQAIVDLGCGSGQLTQQLSLNFPKSSITAVDIALGMINFCQLNIQQDNIHWLCADAEQLPVKTGSCDFVFSNLMFQWSTNLQKLLQETARILKPNGILLFSTLGPNTLKELRHCWRQVDDYPHVHSFTPIENLIPVLNKNNYAIMSAEIKNYFRYFPHPIDLMRELKMLGASNIHNRRSKYITPHKKLQSVLKNYEKFRNHQALLPATYEVYFFTVRKVF